MVSKGNLPEDKGTPAERGAAPARGAPAEGEGALEETPYRPHPLLLRLADVAERLGVRAQARAVYFETVGRLFPRDPGYRFYRLQKRKRREAAWVRRPAGKRPPLPPPKAPDVFIAGVIDWYFRTQRPQHLAMKFADAGHRVFYLTPDFVDLREPGFRVEEPYPGVHVVRLCLEDTPPIYTHAPGPGVLDQLRAGAAELLAWTRSPRIHVLVQHPFWFPLARSLPNRTLVYDCMDLHAGFSNNAQEVLEIEEALLREADLTVTSSAWLEAEAARSARRTAIVRNGCEYDRFSVPPPKTWSRPKGAPVIGYYGAIAEWFDAELVSALARRFPQARILLVGADTAGKTKALRRLPNVVHLGEKPYEDLPRFLHAMDVCVIPFERSPLILATNPVKAYEFLAAGKPVVAPDLPEAAAFEGLVRTAPDRTAFCDAVAEALEEEGRAAGGDGTVRAAREARRAFAARQDWSRRVELYRRLLAEIPEPLVSVVVVTYGNLELTRACLESLERDSDYPCLEVIVVDNASPDGTPAFLREFCSTHPRFRCILNRENRGFPAANNQGLAEAKGEYLVLLNNDTVVTPGWVRTLAAHLRRDPSIGLIGPVTNNIGNEARVPTTYTTLEEMREEARRITLPRMGCTFPIRTLAFFCAMMPRRAYERAGPLDEEFGLGFFEDDDYCRRLERLGFRIACAEDVFVHHHLSAAFDRLGAAEKKRRFEESRRYYESKWGAWIPHRYRSQA